MKLNYIITSLVALIITTECMAWGQKGHDTTCKIAEKHMTKRTLRHVTKILEGKSIVYWCNWLDNASHTDEYAYTKTWHYKNIDAGQNYDDVPPIATGNVETAINEQIEKIKSGTLSPKEEKLALIILIHLVGDMHQPMHMGHLSDLGGNQVDVVYFNKKTNIHSVWDTSLVESAHAWSSDEWAVQIDRISKKEKKAIEQGTIRDWAKETFALVGPIYEDVAINNNLSYDYVSANTEIIEQQFLKGGIRLAKILNALY